MNSLLFLPDISGFTEFVQTTEVSHSQHVIAELLEILIDANTEGLELAEVEGDALFFYKNELLSAEKLLAQIETMFTAFYSHLKLLEKNRICPCKACSSAPNLKLKIVAHCGEIEFITIKGKQKPFGKEVIEAHRLLKNMVESDEYVLLSETLLKEIKLPIDYSSVLFSFRQEKEFYDGVLFPYVYSLINIENLKLKPFEFAKEVEMVKSPDIVIEKEFPLSEAKLLEYITNYAYREKWTDGVDEFVFNSDEVTRIGTEHMCIINGKHLNFTTITKKVESDQLIYGEHSLNIPVVQELHQFFIITPLGSGRSMLRLELYFTLNTLLKKLFFQFVLKKSFQKNIKGAAENLFHFITSQEGENKN